MALASAVAGLGCAVVDVDVAGRSFETLETFTGEALDSINAAVHSVIPANTWCIYIGW